MAALSFPLFIAEGDDVLVVLSSGDVATALEELDIRTTVFEAFDAAGRRLSVNWVAGKTAVVPLEDEPSDVNDLARLLRIFLGLPSNKDFSQGEALAGLVKQAGGYAAR